MDILLHILLELNFDIINDRGGKFTGLISFYGQMQLCKLQGFAYKVVYMRTSSGYVFKGVMVMIVRLNTKSKMACSLIVLTCTFVQYQGFIGTGFLANLA